MVGIKLVVGTSRTNEWKIVELFEERKIDYSGMFEAKKIY